MMKRPLLFLALVLGLVAASLTAITLKPAVLGLDLQGGVEVVLQGQPTDETDVTPEAIERSVEIIRSRVDAFGVAEPEIQTQGSDQIVVALPGAEDPQQVVNDLIQPAQLVFINFQQNLASPPEGHETLLEAIERSHQVQVESDRGSQQLYALDKGTGELVAGPEVNLQALREVIPRGTALSDYRVERVPPGLFLAYQEEAQLTTRENGETIRRWFVFHNNPGLTGRDVTEARGAIDTRPGSGNDHIVTMQFTDEGQRRFTDITAQLARDGRAAGQLHSFAIILDGEIISAPTIDYNEFPAGIRGSNGAQIQGDFTRESADTLAKQINSGALPITLEPINLRSVGPTLGKQSLEQGLIAGFTGLLLVMLFMILYYRFLGVVASLALVVYAIMLYAVFVLVPVTLTLPGIAGIILTIGVASDANVVIFERVREEARSGKAPRAAILAGYKKGLAAIIDANVVTVATAAILFLFATAGVKGFALTLVIGTLLSLFTAVVATQAAFNVLANTRFLRDDRFMALHQREIQWKMDFVGRWKLWMAISFIPLAVGAGWIGINGLNLGMEFESGTRVSMSFDRPATEDQLRAIVRDQGLGEAKVQATSEQIDDREVEGFLIQTETLNQAQVGELRRTLDAEFGLVEQSFQEETVGPTFGRQVIENALWAIVLSFIVVVAYLTIRFEYKLAIPALVTVVHDVWLAVAIYSFTGREITTATVAALLTILGYSLYDVVIVFDRIRENLPLMRRSTYRHVVNTSIHETLNRSIITSLTTLIPLTVLFFFGGDTLKDFAFALIVGMLAGTTSSLAIAGPLAALWKEREPEGKRRQTKAERRRRAIITEGDSDVVDLDALAQAEAGLAAELAAEQALLESGEQEQQADEKPSTGERRRRRRPEPEEGPVEVEVELDLEAEGREDEAAEDAPAGDGEQNGEPPRTRERRPHDPNRQRRHHRVQRKRR